MRKWYKNKLDEWLKLDGKQIESSKTNEWGAKIIKQSTSQPFSVID